MNVVLTRPGTLAPLSPEFRVAWGLVIIAVCVFLAYLPAINGGFVLDDDTLVTRNDQVKASDGLSRIWCTSEEMDFWPVTNTAFWLEWRLWRMAPAGYHVTNLILHIAEALLIWLILRRLSIPGAYLAALIFVIHPVNVESVAWIASRKNLMAMLFFLLSILWYLKFIEHARRPFSEWCPLVAKQDTAHCPLITVRYLDWYWLSLAAFVLAMLSKGSAAVMPVLVLGIIWWLRPLTRRDFLLIVPFAAIALALSAVNVWFQAKDSSEAIRSAGILQRFLGAGGVVWFYLYKALLPLDLSFAYRQWHIQAGNLLWWMPLVAAVAVTVVLWLFRNSWGRPLLFFWGFFCVALLPVMGFSDVGFMRYSLVADHYQHISLIGAVALAAAGWTVWHNRALGESLANAAMIVGVCLLILLTFWQSGIYRDPITLYTTTLEKNPDFWLGYYNLGVVLDEAGQTREAIKCYRRTLQINPDYSTALNNLGVALNKIGQTQEAIKCYKQALQINPSYFPALNNLGIIYLQEGRVNEAIENYRQSLRFDPNYYNIYINLGALLAKEGKTDDAVETYKLAIRLKPSRAEAYYNLGNAYKAAGRYDDAIEQYKAAIQYKPDWALARNNLGVTLTQAGRPEEAVEQCKEAIRLKPDYPQARYNLGLALSRLGKVDEAMECYREALRLDPNYTDAHYNLANALFQANKLGEAIEHYQRVLEQTPDYPEAQNNLGLALVRSGRPLEAIPHYEEALRLRPAYLVACRNLIYAYAQIDQPSKAVATAQKALQLARSQGQTALAQELEDWLKSYSAKAPGAADSPPSDDDASPQPH